MVDVIVIGAGPAGSVTAMLLRRLGYTVEIWERDRFPRHRIGESLPPRAVALLNHLGFRFDAFAVMEGHTTIWGKESPYRAVFEEGYGLQVERDRFDQLLLAQSDSLVHFETTAKGLLREDGRVVGVRSQNGETKARFVVLAGGAGKAPRHRQSAIFGYWKNTNHPEGSQANDTIIESFPDGWVWSLRLASGLRNVTVVFDRPGTPYLKAIQQTSFVSRMVEKAELIGKPVGCDASWQCETMLAEPGLVHVGDAGSVIDPLSSQGVYKALCSAMSAAVVINTCLRKPELEPAALQFFNQEERRTYDGYCAGSVATFRAEQRWPERPFWQKRHELSAWDVPARPFSAEIANAIESGNAVELRVRNAKGTAIVAHPIISGAFIEMADFVVSATFDYGYRGPYAETIVEIHRALSVSKPVGQLMPAENPRKTATRLRVLAYMYREGLIETG